MRYWIYWNEMVQGPFELEELTSLHAFSEELSVCMEGREDWVPASRVADLAPAIELLRSRRAPPSPPPPPPNHPPTLEPLQGEFFSESQSQQHLFDTSDEPKGPYSFAPRLEGNTVITPLCTVTMPIRFRSGDFPVTAPAAPPAPVPFKQPAPKPDFEVLELPPARYSPPAPVKESPLRRPEPVAPPEVVAPPAPIAPSPKPVPTIEIHRPAAFKPEPIPPKVVEDVFVEPAPSALPDLTVPEVTRKPLDLHLLPWFLGVVVALALMGTASYWLIDHFSSREAIAEFKRLNGKKKAVQPSPLPAPVIEPPKAVLVEPVKRPALPPVVKKKAEKKPTPPATKPVVAKPVPKPEPVVVPGLVTPTPDLWIGRQNDAIQMVTKQKIFSGKRTVGEHARMMLKSMHQKELIHAAETGERLYLPDKSSWAALREDGAVYRVYLNFSGLQANGERVQSRSYQFRVDLAKKEITSDDSATRQDFLESPTMPVYENNPMAVDIESILSAVDLLNKQKLRQIIVKNNKASKQEAKNIDIAIAAAQAKVQRATVYFRTHYPERALENIARAYAFTAVLKANG